MNLKDKVIVIGIITIILLSFGISIYILSQGYSFTKPDEIKHYEKIRE